MLQKHCLYLSILIIMDYSLFPSWEYMLFEYGVYGYLDIIWCGIYLVVLHHVAFCIALAYGVMSRTYGSDRTGTTSFIGHNDADSYLVGYEGRSSYASICIHHWFGINVQLHTLMGMKARVHVHWFAFLAKCWTWWRYSITYRYCGLWWHARRCGLWELDIYHMCASYVHCFVVWMFGYRWIWLPWK